MQGDCPASVPPLPAMGAKQGVGGKTEGGVKGQGGKQSKNKRQRSGGARKDAGWEERGKASPTKRSWAAGKTTSKEKPLKGVLGSQRLQLPAGEKVAISGYATLRVLAGDAWISGYQLSESHGPIDILVGPQADDCAVVESLGIAPKVPQAGRGNTEIEVSPAAAELGVASFSALRTDQQRGAVYPEPWRGALERVVGWEGEGRGKKPAPLVVVVGAKGAGKSTFARLMVNELLNCWGSVAFVDTDAGQPEFSPPGLVSINIVQAPILGPPHEHQRTTWDRAAFVGDVSPSTCPDGYLAAVLGLLDWARGPDGCPGIPMVLNTHGWVKGLGVQILVAILQASQPSHVVQLEGGVPIKDLPKGLLWWSSGQQEPSTPPVVHITIPSAKNPTIQALATQEHATAAQSRANRWAAWARLCSVAMQKPWKPTLTGSVLAGADTIFTAANLLAEATPYVVPVGSLQLRFLHTRVPEGEELRVANGAVVGMIAYDQSGVTHCIGMGLIRAVDVPGKKLYMLTPTPRAALPSVRELLIGSLGLPSQLLHSDRYASPYMSLFCLAAEGTGSGSMKSRNNLARRSLLDAAS